MVDVVEEFGLNAGRVWTALNSCGPLTENQLMEESSLRIHELFAAIGWLARENKICKDGDFFRLDQTNLTDEIGTNAGKVWWLLNSENKVDTNHIINYTNLNNRDVYSALGWLARENKIRVRIKNKT
jgi:hypothetical protein